MPRHFRYLIPMITATISKLLFIVGIVGWYVIRYPFQRRARRLGIARSTGGTRDRVLLLIAAFGQFLLPAFYVFVSVGVGNALPGDYAFQPLQGWLGLLVLIGALILFRITHKQLGRNWSITLETREGHKLVTDGIYGWVRHPMYSSFIMFALAQALLLPNWIFGLIGIVAIFILFFMRVPREEAMMVETFGEEYRAYMRRTARVLPGVF